MKNKSVIFVLIVVFLILSCGGGGSGNDADAEWVGARNFSFNTIIDASTLTQEDSFRLYESFSVPRDEAYVIQSNSDLDAFNQTLTTNEQLSLSDTDTHTYFFIRDPGCPDYFAYSTHSYSHNLLIIALDHFHQPNVGCTAEMQELIIVFKADKSF